MAEFKLKSIVPTERQEQLALMQWVNLQPLIRDIFLHIPNEGKRNPIQGYVMARCGLKKGVSDYYLPLPRKSHHGLWIELKRREGGIERKEQKDWINRMKQLGYAAQFCYGCDEAIEVIKEYLRED